MSGTMLLIEIIDEAAFVAAGKDLYKRIGEVCEGQPRALVMATLCALLSSCIADAPDEAAAALMIKVALEKIDGGVEREALRRAKPQGNA